MTEPRITEGGRPIRVLGGAMYLDSDKPNGVKIEATNSDGWLHVVVEADEGIIGYAVTVNGKDLPYLGATDAA